MMKSTLRSKFNEDLNPFTLKSGTLSKFAKDAQKCKEIRDRGKESNSMSPEK